MKKKEEGKDYAFDMLNEQNGVVSMTECTGLMPTPPQSEEEAESYNEIYVVPKVENEYRGTKK
jgi:hypothetical protein